LLFANETSLAGAVFREMIALVARARHAILSSSANGRVPNADAAAMVDIGGTRGMRQMTSPAVNISAMPPHQPRNQLLTFTFQG
jgi:hypothetical protein